MIVIIKFIDKILTIDFRQFEDIDIVTINNLPGIEKFHYSDDFIIYEGKTALLINVDSNFISDNYEIDFLGMEGNTCSYSVVNSKVVNMEVPGTVCTNFTSTVTENFVDNPETTEPIATAAPQETPKISVEFATHIESIDSNIQSLNISVLSLNIIVLFVLILSILRKLLRI